MVSIVLKPSASVVRIILCGTLNLTCVPEDLRLYIPSASCTKMVVSISRHAAGVLVYLECEHCIPAPIQNRTLATAEDYLLKVSSPYHPNVLNCKGLELVLAHLKLGDRATPF